MTASNYPACLAFTLQHEGGFVDNPDDPGRATNMGITSDTMADWLGRHVTVQDVRDLTPAVASKIYTANYWHPVHGDTLPAGLDLMLFDFGVNAGPSTSIKRLQGTLNLRQDGVIGPQTIAAINSHGLPWLIAALEYSHRVFYNSLATENPAETEFLAGWLNRCADRAKTATAMAT